MSKSLLKFRTRNHKLQIQTGRWAGISLSERKCKLCFNDVGDEYHYLLRYKHFCVERTRFIKPYYFKRVNSVKYRDLMNTENKTQLKDLCKFIQIIISKVSQTLNGFTQFQVHHYYLKDQALYFVSARYGPWEVFALCVNLFGVSKAFLLIKIFSQERSRTAHLRISQWINYI